MTHVRRTLALTLFLLAVAPTLATAGIGDYHTITGPIILWGPDQFGEQIAVMNDDAGRRWVVRFAPRMLPPGTTVGTELTVLGREAAVENELYALSTSVTSVSALPVAAASGWAVVPGAVQRTSELTAVLRGAGGSVITVDLSLLDTDARTMVATGRGVTVVGVYRADGVLSARGVAANAP